MEFLEKFLMENGGAVGQGGSVSGIIVIFYLVTLKMKAWIANIEKNRKKEHDEINKKLDLLTLINSINKGN